jgi:hypothetical protein
MRAVFVTHMYTMRFGFTRRCVRYLSGGDDDYILSEKAHGITCFTLPLLRRADLDQVSLFRRTGYCLYSADIIRKID